MNTILETDQLATPYFALALSRDLAGNGYGGIMTIGELPDLSDPRVNTTNIYTTQIINPGAYGDVDYRINADIAYGTPQLNPSIQGPVSYLVDSGTTLLHIPASDAAAFNALWDPPSLTHVNGIYRIDCAAKPAKLVVKIDGVNLEINPLDLVRRISDGTCYSTVAASPAGYTLGEVFLRNVLAVYDWGQRSMQ
jgi:hypothetical protein